MATNDSNDGSKAHPRDEDPGGGPPQAAMPTTGSNALAPDGANGGGNPPTNTGENAATSYEVNKTFASVSNLAKSQGWTPPLEGTPGHNMGLMQAKTAAYTAVTKLIASYHVTNVGAFNKHSDNAMKNTIAGVLAGYGFGPNSLLMKNALDTLQDGYNQDEAIVMDQDEQAVTAKGSSVMEHSGTESGSESLVAGVRPLRIAEGRSLSPPKDKRTKSGSDTQTEAAVASPSDNAEKKAPIIDGAIFKDALTASNVDYMADDPLNYEAAFGPDYELKGVVTHFTHIHSFLDPRVVEDDSPTALTATVEECAQDDTLVPNEYILGCTVGCAPNDVHLLTEHNLRTVAGAIAIGSVGPYKILAVYSGIDLSDWDNKVGAFTPQDVEADAKRQAEALAQFASLAVKTNMPLTLVLYGTKQAPIDVYEWAKSVLSRVPGWTKDRRILLTRVMNAVEDIEDFMCMFPHTTVEVTQPFLALASANESVRLWITRVPWQKLGVASLTPMLADQETGNNPADCVNVVNVLAAWTGEDPHYIAESTARAVAFHYGTYAQKPRVFDNAPCLKAKVKKMNWVEYNNYLQRTYGAQSAGGGPEVKHPDALRDMRLPSPPVHAAAAAEVEKQPVLAKQPAPLGAVHLQNRHGELRQTTVFTVDDETETGWEFVRQHGSHPQADSVRFHPIVSSVADEWKKHMVFTNPKDQKRVTRIGHAVIDCFGQVLLVVYATRWARKYADRVLAYLDQIMGTHDLATLERATVSFTLYIIDREVQAYEEAEKAGNAPAERPNPDRCCLTPNDTYKAIRFWYCRCETAYRYFLANFSGNIAWFSTFMTSCQTPNVGNAFVANLQGQFAEQMNLARFKHYLEQVTKEINLRMGRDGRPVWPPIPTSYRVDMRRMYHSRTVVLVDDWAKQHFSQNIRKDIDVISLPADPTVAKEAIRQMFFCYTVKKLVLFYGKEAIDLSRSRALFDFYRWSSDHLSRLFGRIDVYFVHPPFSYFQRQPWRDATLSGLAENPDVNRYLTVVTYHLDLRLAEYYRAHPSSEWPAEALQEQTKASPWMSCVQQASSEDYPPPNAKTANGCDRKAYLKGLFSPRAVAPGHGRQKRGFRRLLGPPPGVSRTVFPVS
ncbi:hypothetical protein AAVH_25551 [Aphelenchoides avenae]|nr:hypothetical protein AAVH_25551 [Aphelenchus avenae]